MQIISFSPLPTSIILNGSIAVIPKATFFNGRTFSLSQAAARVAAPLSTRATCSGSSCFDSIFESSNSRTSVDVSTSQSFSLYMNYNEAAKSSRTPSIPLDTRGGTHNFLVTCVDCWAYVSASITFAASFQVIVDDAFPPAQFQSGSSDKVKFIIL
jgi:hypothetical protein